MKLPRNLLFGLFLPIFILLYVAANRQNTLLGVIGVGLLVIDAVAALLSKQ